MECYSPPLRIKGYRNCSVKSVTLNSFVYLSRKLNPTHDEVILKYIPYENLSSHDEIEMECNIQESLHHKYIMPIIKHFDIPNGFRVLEMPVAFDNLENLKVLKNINQIFKIMFQIAIGVSYLHSEKVLHGDLKPSNVVLMNDDIENPSIRIIDFGHAIKFKNSSPDNCYCHCKKITRGFSAPELLRKEPHSFPADIWSLGATYYYIITGCHITNDSYLNFNRSFGTNFPNSGKILIRKMMDPNPSKRPTAEMIVNNDFFKEVIGDECNIEQILTKKLR